jgi:hypothetical protein
LLINPYNFSSVETPDSLFFQGLGFEISSKNNYTFGAGAKAVGYASRGDSDDWMYSDDSKNKILAVTPEAGHYADGFWPEIDRIEAICKDNLPTCYQYLWSAGSNLRPVEVTFDTDSKKILLRIKNLGLDNYNEATKVKVKSLDPSVLLDEELNLLPLNANGEQRFTLQPEYKDGYLNGSKVLIEVKISQHDIARLDTFQIRTGYKLEKDIIFDKSTGIQNWSSDQWGLEYSDDHQEIYLTDSPFYNYNNFEDNYIYNKNSINLKSLNNADLEIVSKWSIESTFDAAVLQVSDDGGKTWSFLKNQRTVKGRSVKNSKQTDSSYSLQGNIPEFIKLVFHLDDYLGKEIKLRLGLLSDNGLSYDGWLIKSLAIIKYPKENVFVEEIAAPEINIYPNPVSSASEISIRNASKINLVEVYDLTGRKLYSGFASTFTLSANPGIYFIKVQADGKQTIKKLQIVP